MEEKKQGIPKGQENEQKSKRELLLQERKKAIYNLILILTAAFVVLIGILTMAWFAKNMKTGMSGMNVSVDAGGFNLRVSSGEIGFSNLHRFLDSSLTGNNGTITNESANGQVISWRFVDGDDMLMPGSQGVLEFDVVSNGGNIDHLKYKLAITGYVVTRSHTVTDNTDPENPIETEEIDELEEINASNGYTGAILNAVSYLNSHILFFTGRNGSSVEDYTYYGFIDDKESFELTLNNGAGKIYWIWPNTLGQIALDATDTNYISGVPVLYSGSATYSDDRTALITYLKEHQTGIFKGTETSYSSLVDDLYSKKGSNQPYKTEFDKLSEGYNSADQEIGNLIDYVLVHMIVDMR